MDLDSPVALVQLSVTVYLGVFAVAQLVLGPLSDVYGRRAIIGLGLAVFLLADIGCALATSMPMMLLARAVQAIGGAAVAVTVPALVRDLFERDDYARVMGLVMLVMALAPLLAPSVGGLIILYASWRWVFAALLVITLLTGLVFFSNVPETLPAERRHPLRLRHVLGNYRLLLAHAPALGYLLTGAASFGGMMVFIVTSSDVYIDLYGCRQPGSGRCSASTSWPRCCSLLQRATGATLRGRKDAAVRARGAGACGRRAVGRGLVAAAGPVAGRPGFRLLHRHGRHRAR